MPTRATGDLSAPVHCRMRMTSLGLTQRSDAKGHVTTHLWKCRLCSHLLTVTDHHPKEAT